MLAGIITIPNREEYLNPLVKVIEPSVDKLVIFKDTEHKGHWFNLERCMRQMIDSAKKDEPVLIMCDDVITVPDWRERWEKLHSLAKNDIYVLMARQKHLFTKENLDRGYVTKVQLRGYYDHASIFINQHGLMDRVLKWFYDGGKDTPPLIRRQKHFDVVIQEYLIATDHKWTISIPTLFNHIGDKSSLGHNVGGSPVYIGDL